MANKHLMTFAGLLVIILAFATLSARVDSPSQVKDRNNSEADSGLASFNDKVRLARGGDETAVANLTAAVFRRFATPETAEVLSRYNERFVRAELNYRRDKTSGIPEARLVETLNRIASCLFD